MLHFAANLSLLFAELPITERFAAARAAGFDAVEIQFPYELSIPQLRQLLADNQLTLILINVPAGDLMTGGNGLACVPGQEAAYRAALQEAKAYADALQVPFINVLSGRQPQGVSSAECQAVLESNIPLTLDTFRNSSTQVLVEVINNIDMPHFFLHQLEVAAQLCQKFPALKIQYDCYHMARMGKAVLPELKKYLPLIGHIQFADCPGRHEPGSGTINFAEIFSFLKTSDYRGYCAAEYRCEGNTAATLHWFQAE